jgi:chromosome partitioning protein
VTISKAKEETRAMPSRAAPTADPVPPAGRRKPAKAEDVGNASGAGSRVKGAKGTKAAKPDPIPPETPGVARIIAIANQKGGVGKSTTAVSLGASLADLGYRVLVIDLDPQGNASTGMGIRHEARETTVYHVIVAESPIDDAIVHTAVDRLHAVPSTIDLAGAEIELVSQFSRESRLKKALLPVREGRYDFVLLDCPPSLGLLTVNALTAAEEHLVPIQCEYYALEGLGQLLRNVSLVQQNINPDLRLSGIVMTMFDPRTKLSEQVVEEVQRFFGDLVYDVIIPRTVRLSEAPGFGQPISVYDPRSKGAETYRQLASEVASRPPPAEPMPVYDDLPTVVLPAIVDTVTPEPADTEDLEEAQEPPTPSVEELTREKEAPVEAQTADPEPTHNGDDPPPPIPTQTPGPDRGREKRPTRRVAQERAGVEQARPSIDEDDIWEDSDEPVPPEPEQRLEPARSRDATSPPGADAARSAEPPPDRARAATPPERLPSRRVVVIDENADLAAPPGSGSSGRDVDEPDSPPAVASIGATLEEEAHGKRRWRLFRKGGA